MADFRSEPSAVPSPGEYRDAVQPQHPEARPPGREAVPPGGPGRRPPGGGWNGAQLEWHGTRPAAGHANGAQPHRPGTRPPGGGWNGARPYRPGMRPPGWDAVLPHRPGMRPPGRDTVLPPGPGMRPPGGGWNAARPYRPGMRPPGRDTVLPPGPGMRPPGGGWNAARPYRPGMRPPDRDTVLPPGPGMRPPGGGWNAARPRRRGTRLPGRQAVQPQPPSGNILARVWQKNRALLVNAGSLYASTIINSVLGFAFWALAAHVFTTSEVGFGSAAISAMGVLSTIGMFGLNTLLIGELPKRESKGGLIWAALLTAGAGSFILGLGFALVVRLSGGSFSNIGSDPQQFVVFVGGVTIIGMSLVFDEATIGMLQGRLQLWRNFIFVITKLLLLPVAAFFLHDKFGAGIVASWVAGAVLSIGIIALQLLITGKHVFPRPDWGALKALRGLTLIHNWLNLAISVPWMILPVLVTITVGPKANAAFYIAWMLSGFLRIIPIHLATVLFAVASEDMRTLGPQLRFSLRASMLIGIPAMLTLCLGSQLLLTLFGASYAKMGVIPLILLSLGYLPSVFTVHYITVCRATGRISRAARILTFTACLQIAAAVIGGKEAGLVGFGLGVLAVGVLEGLITAPSVLRAARSFNRTRRAHHWMEVDRGESVYRRYRREYI